MVTSDTMISISLLSFRSVLISCSGSLWIPTQQPFTKIFVALKHRMTMFKHDINQFDFAPYHCFIGLCKWHVSLGMLGHFFFNLGWESFFKTQTETRGSECRACFAHLTLDQSETRGSIETVLTWQKVTFLYHNDIYCFKPKLRNHEPNCQRLHSK